MGKLDRLDQPLNFGKYVNGRLGAKKKPEAPGLASLLAEVEASQDEEAGDPIWDGFCEESCIMHHAASCGNHAARRRAQLTEYRIMQQKCEQAFGWMPTETWTVGSLMYTASTNCSVISAVTGDLLCRVNISSFDSVRDVKHRISQTSGIPEQLQIIFSNGAQQLKDAEQAAIYLGNHFSKALTPSITLSLLKQPLSMARNLDTALKSILEFHQNSYETLTPVLVDEIITEFIIHRIPEHAAAGLLQTWAERECAGCMLSKRCWNFCWSGTSLRAIRFRRHWQLLVECCHLFACMGTGAAVAFLKGFAQKFRQVSPAQRALVLQAAVLSLRCHAVPAEVCAELTALMRDEHPALRLVAVRMCRHFGGQMKPFVNTIADLLDDPMPDVVALAVRALRGFHLKPHLSKIASLLHHPDRGVRYQAVLCVGSAGLAASPYAADIAIHLQDNGDYDFYHYFRRENSNQRAAFQALRWLGVLEFVDAPNNRYGWVDDAPSILFPLEVDGLHQEGIPTPEEIAQQKADVSLELLELEKSIAQQKADASSEVLELEKSCAQEVFGIAAARPELRRRPRQHRQEMKRAAVGCADCEEDYFAEYELYKRDTHRLF